MQNKLFHRLIATFVLITTVSIPQITFAGACQAQTSTALSNKSNTPHEDECQNYEQQQKNITESKQPLKGQFSSNRLTPRPPGEDECHDGHPAGSKFQTNFSNPKSESKIMMESPVRIIIIEPRRELANKDLPNLGKEVLFSAKVDKEILVVITESTVRLIEPLRELTNRYLPNLGKEVFTLAPNLGKEVLFFTNESNEIPVFIEKDIQLVIPFLKTLTLTV
ncbi:MAG: hypothetical protein V7K88_30645 [Nostoc sp.]|uniref:hypothetical protein n=1 Tax=Nostoc sp. TaxID=1180 RepID=UPI002FF65DF3